MKESINGLSVLLFVIALLATVPAQTASKKRTATPKKKSAPTRAKNAGSAKTSKKPGIKPSKPKSTRAAKTSKPNPSPTPVDPAVEKAEFEAASSAAAAVEKATLLVKFIADHPKSENIVAAGELLAAARASMANDALTGNEVDKSIGLFKLAVAESPKPYTDKFFKEIIAVIPANLYFRGQREAGLELARQIEAAISGDPKKLVELANFYLNIENAGEARRLAETAANLDDKSALPYLTLGMAERLSFNIDGAAADYAKALEMDPSSLSAKRSLAEMKRALGKAAEAVPLYRELVTADPNDNVARTGLVLSLFDAGEKAEAEREMTQALEAVPGNVILLAGAAYWYAVNKDGNKAVGLAQQAIAKEPRFIWSYIALGRGLMLQGKPVDAERVLIGARKYGNFPTLHYEIASARMAAGFYREAAEEMQKYFKVEDGKIHTALGGRVENGGTTFSELLAGERRASIFAPLAAEDPENARRLKTLLEFEDVLSTEQSTEAGAVVLAEDFSSGDDNMSVFRKLFASQRLLDKKVAPGKALELAQSAVQYLDQGLNVANAGAATMASELYEARTVSFARDDFLLIPDVPKQTLSALNRGRVEQLSGRALLAEGKAADAETRFRRALTVFPKDSAWWRSASWNLGESLEAQGKEDQALETYISSYKIDKPDGGRYLKIQLLYKKVKGSTDGLVDRIGESPFANVVAANETPVPSPLPVETSVQEASPSPSPVETPVFEASPSPSPTETPVVETSTSPAETPVIEASRSTSPTPTETPEPTPTAKEIPVVAALPSPSPSPTETPVIEASPSPSPTPAELVVETSPSPSPTPTAEASPSPSPSPTETPVIDGSPSPASTEGSVAEVTTEKPKASEEKRPIFDPVIIPVGRSGPPPSTSTNTVVADKKPGGKPTDPAPAPASRPRVVEGKEIRNDGELQPCTITVSQEKVSVLNNGGSIALIVNFDGPADTLAAVSSSPKDIEAHLEPGIISVAGRYLFVIKSVSEKTGVFEINFGGDCGKKKVLVEVR